MPCCNSLTTKHGYVETFDHIDLLPSGRSLVYSFRVGDSAQPEGVLCEEAVEAIDGTRLCPLPDVPLWHAGLLMYRDTPLPVIDLSRLLYARSHEGARNVIVVRHANELLGLLVDELADVPEFAASRILPIDELVTSQRAALLDRAVRPEQGDDPILMILNIGRLFEYVTAATDISGGFPEQGQIA
ncbi:MAG: CheW domain-containing protein [Pseudomonadota bacterium]